MGESLTKLLQRQSPGLRCQRRVPALRKWWKVKWYSREFKKNRRKPKKHHPKGGEYLTFFAETIFKNHWKIGPTHQINYPTHIKMQKERIQSVENKTDKIENTNSLKRGNNSEIFHGHNNKKIFKGNLDLNAKKWPNTLEGFKIKTNISTLTFQ